MPPSPTPPVPVSPTPVAPPAKITIPNIAGGIGAFFVVLGMGWQSFAQQNPDEASELNGLTGQNLVQIAGILVMVGGFGMHSLNGKSAERDSKAKIEAAALAPPVGAFGQSGSCVTLAAGCEQLINEGQHDVAVKVIEAMKGVQS